MNNQNWRKNYWLVRETEIRIQHRLGRATDLEDLSATTLEQLNYLAKHGTDDLLSKALNEAIQTL